MHEIEPTECARCEWKDSFVIEDNLRLKADLWKNFRISEFVQDELDPVAVGSKVF